MGASSDRLSDKNQSFIRDQRLFFVATSPDEGRISVSPKGMDTFRCLDERRVGYLDLTGSSNETAAHVAQNSRITLMFCSFDATPLILRIYGRGRVVHRRDADWEQHHAAFFGLDMRFRVGVRQIILVEVELVRSSCGHGVPRFDFVSERENMPEWLDRLGEQGMDEYRERKNQVSIDGLPTRLLR